MILLLVTVACWPILTAICVAYVQGQEIPHEYAAGCVNGVRISQ